MQNYKQFVSNFTGSNKLETQTDQLKQTLQLGLVNNERMSDAAVKIFTQVEVPVLRKIQFAAK